MQSRSLLSGVAVEGKVDPSLHFVSLDTNCFHVMLNHNISINDQHSQGRNDNNDLCCALTYMQSDIKPTSIFCTALSSTAVFKVTPFSNCSHRKTQFVSTYSNNTFFLRNTVDTKSWSRKLSGSGFLLHKVYCFIESIILLL